MKDSDTKPGFSWGGLGLLVFSIVLGIGLGEIATRIADGRGVFGGTVYLGTPQIVPIDDAIRKIDAGRPDVGALWRTSPPPLANRGKPSERDLAQLKEFGPDNVRLVGNRLYTAGIIDNEPACGGAPTKPEDIQCPRGWVVDAIDPKTMAITEIARGPRAAPYTGTATAIPVGENIWLSSFNVDRVAYRALK